MSEIPSVEQIRELLVRADSYLSLLWHRHTPRVIRDDFALRCDVERTIADLRRLAALRASAPSVETPGREKIIQTLGMVLTTSDGPSVLMSRQLAERIFDALLHASGGEPVGDRAAREADQQEIMRLKAELAARPAAPADLNV